MHVLVRSMNVPIAPCAHGSSQVLCDMDKPIRLRYGRGVRHCVIISKTVGAVSVHSVTTFMERVPCHMSPHMVGINNCHVSSAAFGNGRCSASPLDMYSQLCELFCLVCAALPHTNYMTDVCRLSTSIRTGYVRRRGCAMLDQSLAMCESLSLDIHIGSVGCSVV